MPWARWGQGFPFHGPLTGTAAQRPDRCEGTSHASPWRGELWEEGQQGPRVVRGTAKRPEWPQRGEQGAVAGPEVGRAIGARPCKVGGAGQGGWAAIRVEDRSDTSFETISLAEV